MQKTQIIYIDAGNTRLKCLLETELGEQELSFVHNGDVASSFSELLAKVSQNNFQVKDLIVSSVLSKQSNEVLRELSLKNWGIEPKFAEVKRSYKGIKNSYQRLEQMGVDRWVAIHGAQAVDLKGSAYIVIDCGTAITVDAVNSKGVFVGGSILPGIDLALSSLSSADGIANHQFEEVSLELGQTTEDCCRLGVLASCAGGVQKVVELAENQMSEETIKIFTGGASKLLMPMMNFDYIHEPKLIFEGLKRLYP